MNGTGGPGFQAAARASGNGDEAAAPLVAAQHRNRRLNDELAGAQRAAAAARRDAEEAQGRGRARTAPRRAAPRVIFIKSRLHSSVFIYVFIICFLLTSPTTFVLYENTVVVFPCG